MMNEKWKNIKQINNGFYKKVRFRYKIGHLGTKSVLNVKIGHLFIKISRKQLEKGEK